MALKNWSIRVLQTGSLNNLHLEEIEISEIPADHVLVKMECSTVNPSDLYKILGKYPIAEAPFTAGGEGSGTVIKSGGGDYTDSLVGKRVALVSPTGTWAQYSIVHVNSVFPLQDSITFEQAASLCVNPLTIILMIDKITEGGHKTFIQNAAASVLGQGLTQFAKRLNIPHVNLVRRQEQVDLLKGLGCEYVLNTSEEGWLERAKELSACLNITCAFDAIGGNGTKDLCSIIQQGGVVYNYGRLSGPTAEMEISGLIFEGKRLEGLWLGFWLRQKTIEEKIQGSLRVQENIDILTTKYGQEVNLSNLVDAIGVYTSSATNNKILLKNRIDYAWVSQNHTLFFFVNFKSRRIKNF